MYIELDWNPNLYRSYSFFSHTIFRKYNQFCQINWLIRAEYAFIAILLICPFSFFPRKKNESYHYEANFFSCSRSPLNRFPSPGSGVALSLYCQNVWTFHPAGNGPGDDEYLENGIQIDSIAHRHTYWLPCDPKWIVFSELTRIAGTFWPPISSAVYHGIALCFRVICIAKTFDPSNHRRMTQSIARRTVRIVLYI